MGKRTAKAEPALDLTVGQQMRDLRGRRQAASRCERYD